MRLPELKNIGGIYLYVHLKCGHLERINNISRYFKSNSKVLQYKGITYKGYLLFNDGKVFDFNYKKTWLSVHYNANDKPYVIIKIIDKDTQAIRYKNVYLEKALKECFNNE